MSDAESFFGFLFMLIGAFIVGLLIASPSKSNEKLLDQAQLAIKECQKDLPRSQVCELTAKIKEGKE